jgi:formate--tetrahydrofolate ligase
VPLAQVAEPSMQGLVQGFDHLARHLDTLERFGLPAVVAVNRFPNDREDELEALRAFATSRGAAFATHEGFSKGGEGSLELADVVLGTLARTDVNPPAPRFTYELDATPEAKVEAVARNVYGADGVVFTPQAKKQLETIAKMGEGKLPVCIAKTHLSLTDDPTRFGRPTGFTITVREARLSAGAGYIVCLTGELMTMPGLPKEPASRRVVVHDDGRVTGLMQGE